MILGIETSDILCSVAFWDEGRILAEYNHELPMQHASIIGQLVENGLEFLSGSPMKKKYTADDIELVTVGIGPGSFTGLRIGLSYAQGFCYGRNIPIVGISNHQILASLRPLNASEVYTIIEARRDEVYLAKLELGKQNYSVISTHAIVAKTQLPDQLPGKAVLLYKKDLILDNAVIESLTRKSIVICNHLKYSAGTLAALGSIKFQSDGGDDLAEIEPLYIRPFAGVK